MTIRFCFGVKNIVRALGVLCLVFASMTNLNAQATGAILGTVTDMTDALLPGAEVQIRNVGTGQTSDVLTDEQGRYRVPELSIGDYEVSASLPAFSRAVRTGITLTVGAQLVVDFQLAVGQQVETVLVEGQVSPVETQSTAVGVLVESKQIRELPLNGRNYTQLIALNPGVIQIPRGQTGSGTPFYGMGQKYSISGARPSGQNYLLDGTDMTSFWNNGPGSGVLGTALGVESIAEFQALTNTAGAQFGGNSAVINASSRSGTNEFHGSLYEFFRHDALEARDFFDAERPPYRQNQFGGSLGGPIKTNKMFFFANYEGLRTSKTTTVSLIVPNVELINVAGHEDPNRGAYRLPNGQILEEHANPVSRQAIRDALKFFPSPITPIGLSGTAESLGHDRLVGTQSYFLGRLDYSVSDKSTLFGRYILDSGDRDNLGALPYWPNVHSTRSHYFTIQERHILSPTLVNLVRFSFNRPTERGGNYESPIIENGVAKRAERGAPGRHPFDHIPDRDNPTISVGSGVSGLGPVGQLPFYLIQDKFGFAEEIIWTSGAHSIKAGAQATRVRENTFARHREGGNWSFGSLANLLQGRPQSVAGPVSDAQNPQGDAVRDVRYWTFGFYIDDQWTVSPRLTLNAGLRYSPTTKIKSVRHELYVLKNPPHGLWERSDYLWGQNPSLFSWDPRVGLAWDPFGDQRTSIRAGFAIFHSPILGRDNFTWYQPPLVQSTQTAAQGLVYPFPYSNVPVGSGLVIPTDGTLSIAMMPSYQLRETPYLMQWNLNIQREIFDAGVFTIGYLGSRGVHLLLKTEVNSPVPFIGPSGRLTFGVFDAARNTVVANPTVNPTYGAIGVADHAGDSYYHGLQTSFSKRFARGWQTQVSYTFAKSIDTASGVWGIDGGGSITNPYDARAERGLSNFDRRHNFRASGIFELPFRREGALGKLIGGWSVTGIYTYLTGSPISPSSASQSTHNVGGSNSGRPDLIAGCNLYPEVQTRLNWFNPDCFVMQPLGTYGNAGRSIIIGPNFWNLDMSLLKDTSLSERVNLQFRAEAFNILNHPNFQQPGAGIFTSLAGARNPNAGRINGTSGDPRQIQLALKLLF